MTLETETHTVEQWLSLAMDYFSKRDVPEVEANAEFILAEAMGCGRGEVLASGGRTVHWKHGNHFWGMVKKRGRRVPLAYILGTQPFCGLEIKVTPNVLVPRPETEQLVELVLTIARERFPHRTVGAGVLHVVDIGTGSGCIAVTIAKKLPQARVYATEFSETALRVAEENAAKHLVETRIRFLREDLFKPRAAAAPWADMVVSNPPYIPTGELAGLDPEVREEPSFALDGGQDGLDAIRAIAIDASRVLRPGGLLLMEFGFGQGERVRDVLAKAGFSKIETREDLQGIERFSVARLGK